VPKTTSDIPRIHRILEHSPILRAVPRVSDNSQTSCLSFRGWPMCPSISTSNEFSSNPRTSLSHQARILHCSWSTLGADAVSRARSSGSSCRCLESVPCLGVVQELVCGRHSGVRLSIGFFLLSSRVDSGGSLCILQYGNRMESLECSRLLVFH